VAEHRKPDSITFINNRGVQRIYCLKSATIFVFSNESLCFTDNNWSLSAGFVRSPRSVGGRFVTFVWWGYVIMFLFLYLSSLTNYLSVGPKHYAVKGYSKVRDLR